MVKIQRLYNKFLGVVADSINPKLPVPSVAMRLSADLNWV